MKMKKYDLFCDQNNLYELRPGWVVRVPCGFSFMDRVRYRFDPVIAGAILVGGGTLLQMKATAEAGKEAKKIANARAAVDLENAKTARKASVEKAKIKTEQVKRLIETQKAVAAAAGIRINVGSPLVIQSETRANLAKDVGFVLERGRTETGFFESSAAIERDRGEAALKKSKWDAISQGLWGAGSIAFMGIKGGGFRGSKPLANQSIESPAGITSNALNSSITSDGVVLMT
jgi:hypothetical protein